MDRPVWPVFVAWVSATVIALGGSLVVAIAAAVAMTIRSGAATDPERLAAEIPTLPAVVVGSVLVSSGTLLLVSLVAAKLERAPIPERLRLRTCARDALLVVPGAMLVLGFGQVLDSLAHVLGLMELSALEDLARMVNTTTVGWFLVLLVVGSVGPGIGEELFFRGYAQTRLAERWGRWAGIAVASILFGLLHMDPLHAPMAFGIGLALGWLAERAGSVVPCVIVHVLNNAVSFVLLREIEPSLLRDETHLLLGGGGLVLGLAGIAGVLLLTRGRRGPSP